VDEDDELIEILDDSAVSSVSIIARESGRAVLASLIITIVGAAGYGIISAIERTVEMVRFLALGLFTTLKRTIPRLDPRSKNTVVMASATLLLITLTTASALLFFFRGEIISYTFLNEAENGILTLSIAFVFAFLSVTFVMEVLKAYKEITLANLTFRWAAPFFQIVCVAVSGALIATVVGVLYGMVIGLLITTALGAALIVNYTTFNPVRLARDEEMWKDYRSYLGPAILGSVFAGIQFSIYNILMFTVTPTQAGVFGIALILAMFVRLPLESINQIFPQVATQLYQDNRKGSINTLFQSTSKIAVTLALPIAIAIAVFHVEIATFFSAEYRPYSIAFAIVIIGQLCAVLCGTVGYLIMMTDNERENVYLQIFLTVVTLGIAFPLTFWYGLYGLAVAYAFGFFFNNTVEIFYLYYSEGLFPLTRDHLFIVSTSVLLLVSLYSINTVLPTSVAVVVVIVTSITFLTFCFRFFFTSGERAAIHKWRHNMTSSIKAKF